MTCQWLISDLNDLQSGLSMTLLWLINDFWMTYQWLTKWLISDLNDLQNDLSMTYEITITDLNDLQSDLSMT